MSPEAKNAPACSNENTEKPNSAPRKIAKARLSNRHDIFAHIPGEGVKDLLGIRIEEEADLNMVRKNPNRYEWKMPPELVFRPRPNAAIGSSLPAPRLTSFYDMPMPSASRCSRFGCLLSKKRMADLLSLLSRSSIRNQPFAHKPIRVFALGRRWAIAGGSGDPPSLSGVPSSPAVPLIQIRDIDYKYY
ncbi:hypothetical protein IFM89_003303 [Coptis chinensis]|uniref:Uncharacterized protein n=1 Tax=Coptis chinensis TaxID=261450 RepID=A0A835IJM5_9MAGN|nr:hypothetical protein IFM89_003303 [Coptis chinensis]